MNLLWVTAQAVSPAGVEHDSGAGSEDERHQHCPSSLPEKQGGGFAQARVRAQHLPELAKHVIAALNFVIVVAAIKIC